MLTHSEWAEQERKDPEQGIGHNRDLYTVWNEKANFLKVAADQNYFSSSYFLWLDIGAVRHNVSYREAFHFLNILFVQKFKEVLANIFFF